tara:strand:- start:4196 stop:4372 length:177 start_codon:yes stop_codon:yes gene_type:complete
MKTRKYIATFYNKSSEERRDIDYERLTFPEAFTAANHQRLVWGYGWEIEKISKELLSN